MRQRLVLAALSACVVAVLVYAATRAAQALFTPEPNPATIIWSAHAGYFWRAITSAYAAGAVAFAAFLHARARAEQLATWLVRGVRLAAWAIVLQAMLFP